jgi:hypothetical protein
MAGRLIGAWNPALDANGAPLSGSKLITYQAGGTTPKQTFTSAALTTPHTNPVVADSAGRFTEIWAADGATYDLEWTTSADVHINLFEDIQALGSTATGAVTRDFGADGRFNLEARGGVFEVEAGDASPDNIGGTTRIGGWAGSQGDTLTLDYETIQITGTLAGTAQRGAIGGLTLSTAGGSATFGIAAGQATDSTVASSMTLPTAFTKTTASWAVGTAAGALDTGAIAPSTWYHVYLIKRTDSGLVDVLFSLSASAPTLPSGYTLSRRIGAMKTDGSSHWIGFVQRGDKFLWTAVVTDVSAVTPASGATNTVTITVPTGLVVEAILSASTSWAGGTTTVLGIYDTSLTGIAAQVFSLSGLAASYVQVFTNASAQIKTVLTYGTATTYSVVTTGWIDRRGRDD